MRYALFTAYISAGYKIGRSAQQTSDSVSASQRILLDIHRLKNQGYHYEHNFCHGKKTSIQNREIPARDAITLSPVATSTEAHIPSKSCYDSFIFIKRQPCQPSGPAEETLYRPFEKRATLTENC